ncbi:MAG TPA: putative toxin-antitoxin system toxin component, PIN family [Lysobacter sp.]|nr:putative toxin-antitoxin system toxin component, PIN family [Lysobacter sp.]
MAPRVPTFVLDTNAWLDLLVFHDPALAGFEDAANAGELRVAIDVRALDELARVLRYDALRLDEATAWSCHAKASALAALVRVPAPMRLPCCRDPDDQMFLEIAATAAASVLLTRDAELLRLHRRMSRDHRVAIVPPSRWREAAQMSKR